MKSERLRGDDSAVLGVGRTDRVGLAFELGEFWDVFSVPAFSVIARQRVRQRAAFFELESLNRRLERVSSIHRADLNERSIQRCNVPISTRATDGQSSDGSNTRQSYEERQAAVTIILVAPQGPVTNKSRGSKRQRASSSGDCRKGALTGIPILVP
jgi:hypothetical protein